MEKEQKYKNNKFWMNWIIPLTNVGLKKQIDSFVENLLILISSGMDIVSSIKVISEDTASRRMRKRVKIIQKQVSEGVSLSEALSTVKILPVNILSFISLGEKSGKLADNLQIIVTQNEKDSLFKSRIRSALLYAVIIFSLTVVVGVGTAWYTLPKIADVYIGLEVELPVITVIFIKIGQFMARYGIIFVSTFALILFILFYFIFSFPRTKFVGHAILFKIPMIRQLIKEAEVARFSFLLSLMLEAGLTISESLESMKGTTTFSGYKKLYEGLLDGINKGNSLKKSLEEYQPAKKLLPSGVRQIIVAGEVSGGLSKSLLKVGQIYEARSEITAKNLPVILEPLILLIIGIFVALFVIATMLPIFKLSELI